MIRISRLTALALLALLPCASGCTLVGAVAGPFVGGWRGGQKVVENLNSDKYSRIEKIGTTLAAPVFVVGYAAIGAVVGPFVGLDADMEFPSGGDAGDDDG